jgi:hypothetical protein
MGNSTNRAPLEAISDDLEAFYAESAHYLVASCGRAALVSGILDHARVGFMVRIKRPSMVRNELGDVRCDA